MTDTLLIYCPFYGVHYTARVSAAKTLDVEGQTYMALVAPLGKTTKDESLVVEEKASSLVRKPPVEKRRSQEQKLNPPLYDTAAPGGPRKSDDGLYYLVNTTGSSRTESRTESRKDNFPITREQLASLTSTEIAGRRAAVALAQHSSSGSSSPSSSDEGQERTYVGQSTIRRQRISEQSTSSDHYMPMASGNSSPHYEDMSTANNPANEGPIYEAVDEISVHGEEHLFELLANAPPKLPARNNDPNLVSFRTFIKTEPPAVSRTENPLYESADRVEASADTYAHLNRPENASVVAIKPNPDYQSVDEIGAPKLERKGAARRTSAPIIHSAEKPGVSRKPNVKGSLPPSQRKMSAVSQEANQGKQASTSNSSSSSESESKEDDC